MRLLKPTLPLAVLICLVGGCKRSEPPRREDLQSRLASAMQINSLSDKDEALKVVATDAADAGFGDITRQAAAAINSIALRDQTASDCALTLAKNHQGAAAKDLANLINSITLRDKTLRKLAEGP